MNPQEDPRTLIAALGALEVQIATRLLHEPLPVTQTHLCKVLHKTDKTVSKALYNLEVCQICSHSPLGWSNTPDGEIRLFGIRQLSQCPQMAVEPDLPVDNPVDTCPVDGFTQEKGRNFSDPSVPSSTSTSTSSSILTNLNLVENLLPELLDPKPEIEPEPEPEPELEQELKAEPEPKTGLKSAEKIRECYQTAVEAGIWEARANELAEMLHVTPELITHHIETVRAEGKEIPLAIFRIVNHEKFRKPPVRKPQNRKSQGYEDRQKYVTGKNADWIHH